MTDDPEPIWENTIDKGAFSVRVTRTGDYSGQLIILDRTQTIVHQEPVTLAYGAIFGPDVDDLFHWENRTIEVIDDPMKRSIS